MAVDPIQNLFKSRQKKNYDVRKSAVDNRKNLGNDYSENVLRNSTSNYIFRNAMMNDFLSYGTVYIIRLDWLCNLFKGI